MWVAAKAIHKSAIVSVADMLRSFRPAATPCQRSGRTALEERAHAYPRRALPVRPHDPRRHRAGHVRRDRSRLPHRARTDPGIAPEALRDARAARGRAAPLPSERVADLGADAHRRRPADQAVRAALRDPM